MNKYITNLNIGIDENTGLDVELRVKSLTIDSELQKITIKIDKSLVSPTGVELKVIESQYYDRYNSETNLRYDGLALSPIGQGIKTMLNIDLLEYPNLTQK
jgi:hypothetical protein